MLPKAVRFAGTVKTYTFMSPAKTTVYELSVSSTRDPKLYLSSRIDLRFAPKPATFVWKRCRGKVTEIEPE